MPGQRQHLFLELTAALFIIGKLIPAGADWRQQHDIAIFRQLIGLLDGLRQRFHQDRIRSQRLELIARFANECQIEMLGSAEMVELAEAKLHGEDVSLDALKRILRPWLRMKEPPDTVVLGCTHFPLLQEELLQVLPEGTRLVDSGAAIARRTAWLLEHEAPDAKSADANIAFCMAMTPGAEQLLPVLQRYGF